MKFRPEQSTLAFRARSNREEQILDSDCRDIALRGTRKLQWTTDQAPSHLGEDARRRLWRDVFDGTAGPFCDVRHADDRPLAADFEFRRLGTLRLARFRGTMTGVARTRAAIARLNEPLMSFGINRGGAVLLKQAGREAVLPAGQTAAVLWSDTRPSTIQLAPDSAWVTLDVPPNELVDRLGGRVGSVESRLARVIDEPSPALRHLIGYIDLLLEPDTGRAGELFDRHTVSHLIDLVALVLGVQDDATQTAGRRGLRAARLRAVLAEIRHGYTSPTFSVAALAARLGLSGRYVHELLHDSGVSFRDRVLELRLQKAHTLLSSHPGAGMAIIDVVHACGFNDVSYFNRCFRRRFAMTPSAARGP